MDIFHSKFFVFYFWFFLTFGFSFWVHWLAGRVFPMVRETWVQSQVASYQRLQKWYLIPSCLTLGNIRYVSMVKWSNPRKGVAPSPTSRCSSYWKRSLLVALDYGRQLTRPKLKRNWPCKSQRKIKEEWQEVINQDFFEIIAWSFSKKLNILYGRHQTRLWRERECV